MAQMADALKRAQELAAKMGTPAGAASLNGGDDNNSRKRPLDEGDDGPQMKKPTIDNPVPANPTPQAIAQAAIAKLAPVVGAQLGMGQMITVDMRIPNRMVGLVIGRGGEMINKLQTESSARIQVAPDGSEVNGERGVTICGTPDTVERAKALVNKVIEDAGGTTSSSSMPPGGGYNIGGVDVGGVGVGVGVGVEVVREMMIPANKVGLIIGKGGEMIKMLQERAGCRMQMIQDGPYLNTPEKPLRMTGLADCCEKAKRFVTELIEQKEREARGLTAGGKVVEVEVPKSLVGFVIGRNGEHINNIQNTCGVRLQFQNDVPGIDYRIATISGPASGDNCDRARRMIEDIVGEVRTKDLNRQVVGSGGHGDGGGGGGGGGGGYKPHIELPNPTGPGVQTIQFPVPSNKCGLIIGKGGDTIRQLQVQSGCHIELFRGAHPNPNEKLFNIRGHLQNIHHAQSLIRQKCEMQPGAEGYPMSGMPYQGAMFQQGAGPYNAQQGWTQYPFPQGYGGAAAGPQQQQQPGSDPSQQAAWAAYYQQVYAAQQAGQQPGGGVQPQAQANAQSADVQAQWAEYYRQLGMAYYGGQGGQQAGQQPPPGEQPLPEQK